MKRGGEREGGSEMEKQRVSRGGRERKRAK